ncbi:hypothetical protein BDZ90DRAFT_135559 [Jaminaea rosea]|uniref:G-alpha-domain-containing protein n=1 Tax=Jaminaea rosea TaxID=1569628 RepID=A0A316UUK9_9BASI|nr:hypothetical protein BDZ90DRAFT_135559 [Jaminaea rosea]PWN28969.1 hypothetical protein BDZ90DRAFT_135559 [Jaminaea rosea]
MRPAEWIRRRRQPDEADYLTDSPSAPRTQGHWQSPARSRTQVPFSTADASSPLSFAHRSPPKSSATAASVSSLTARGFFSSRTATASSTPLDLAARHRSLAIDKQLRLEAAEIKRERGKERTILLLGQAEAGKTTVFKQMRLLYKRQAFDGEREAWRAIVLLNVMHAVRLLMRAFEHHLVQALEKAAAVTHEDAPRSRHRQTARRSKAACGVNNMPWSSSGSASGAQSLGSTQMALSPVKASVAVRSELAYLDRLRASIAKFLELEAPLRKTLGAFEGDKHASEGPARPHHSRSSVEHTARPWLNRPVSADGQLLLRSGWQERLRIAKQASFSVLSSNAHSNESDETQRLRHIPYSSPRYLGPNGSPLPTPLELRRMKSASSGRSIGLDTKSPAEYGYAGVDGGTTTSCEDYEALAAKALTTIVNDVITLWRRPFTQRIRASGGRFHCDVSDLGQGARGQSSTAASGAHPKVVDGSESITSSSSVYFLDSLARIASPTYRPSDSDILQSRLRTFGVHDEAITLPGRGARYRVIDVGGAKNQRPAWSHLFSGPSGVGEERQFHQSRGHGVRPRANGSSSGTRGTSRRPHSILHHHASSHPLDVRPDLILFLAPLSTYDEVLSEDPRTNRLDDSLELLEQILESISLKDTVVVVLLNKADVLKKKVEAAARGGEQGGCRSVADVWPREWERFIKARKRKAPPSRDGNSEGGDTAAAGTLLPTTAFHLSLHFLESRFRSLVRSKHHLSPQRDVHVRTTVATSEARMREVLQFVEEGVLRQELRGLGLT